MFFDNLLVKNIININNNIINVYFVLQNVAIFILDRINLNFDNKLNCMKKFLKFSMFFGISVLLILGLILSGLIIYINTAKSNVVFDKEKLLAINTTIDIYDTDNSKINELSGRRALINIEELPKYVPASFVSIEDKDFYRHHGLNYKRIVKAFYNNLKSKSLKEGASTISQQLIKNTHLSNEKTITRKINEMSLAKELEKNFSKAEILEMYLNIIYFGNGAYGIENASQTYFGKPATKLSVDESALLAGMIKSPRTYSPILNPESALKRRNLVLGEMKKDGVISSDEYENLSKKNISLNINSISHSPKNFYEEATLEEAKKILNMTENQIALAGYKIWTYQVNADQNSLHRRILSDEYYDKNEHGNIADSAGIIIDNKTGGITAFDGKSVFDIIKMKRSPGSAIKPILVYCPALEYGKISPSTMIFDESKSFDGYSPQNVGGIYYGWIDATKSVEKSLNIPAIKILQTTGIANSKKFAEKAGISFNNDDTSLAIALGGLTNGTSIKQLVNTYIPLANGGNFIEAKFIKKICDKNGKIIYENNEEKNQIMSEETAYLMTKMLISSVKNGTSSRLDSLGFEIAGKTGTVGIKGTNLNSDVWSVGYTPQKTVGVWLGNATGSKENMLEGRNNGGTFCTSIVRDTFKEIDIDKNLKFLRPNGIVDCEIDTIKLEKEHVLMIANPATPKRYTKTALFNKKYAPSIVAEKYLSENLCELSGKIENEMPTLYFDCIKNATYNIYRIEEDVKKLIGTIKNTSGRQKFIDKNANEDTIYTYYIEVLQDDEKIIKSNSIKLTTGNESLFKKILNAW